MEPTENTPRIPNRLADDRDNRARPRRRRRPALTYVITYTILGGALLTLLGTVAAHGRFRQASVRETAAAAPTWTTRPAPAPLAAAPANPPAAPTGATPPKPRPRVELVFALDTTSSMGGLIEGAKQKIWSLASFVAQGQPTPDLRVGLVAYRDLGDEYVTRVFDLDADLDRVYRRLQNLRAEGGGDGPEHVARALHESVHKITWSPAQEVVKVIYLVGDAPPHTDYHDGFDYARAARAAATKGIKLHTIQCGDDVNARSFWQRIATLGGGEYIAIHQDGGMREERSRYDEELAHLHDRLAETTIAYGAERAKVDAENRAAEAAPASIKAARAGFMARNARAISGKGDLVDSLASGEVTLDAVQADLPEAMQRLDRKSQEAYVAGKQKERRAVSQRIDELARLRKADLEAQEAAAASAGAADGFDLAAKKSLKRSVSDNALSGLKL